jgi:predicted transcriptional regulator
MPWTTPEPVRAPTSRLPVIFIHTDAHWEALSSSRRIEMLQTLQSRGPLSLPEVAHLLDAAPDGLYHHARLLERAGLIREVEHRRIGRRTERVLDAAAERLRLDVDVEQDRNSGRLLKLLGVYARRSERHLRDALTQRIGRLEGLAPDIVVHADAAWLDDEDLARVTELLDGIRAVFEHGRARRQGRLCSLTVALSPLVRPRDSASRRTNRAAQIAEQFAYAPPTTARRKARRA